VESVVAAKRLEVCSTSGPQLAVPRIFGDARYAGHLAARAQMYKERAQEARDVLGSIPGVDLSPARGAFYMTARFEPGALNNDNRLPIAEAELREVVERQCKGAAPDARFVYHLLASTGICVVPLTGFYTPHPGFRFTLLESDDAKRAWIFQSLAEALVTYLESDKGHG
jgi:aspartate/methionine/tyrosine aminotransferase